MYGGNLPNCLQYYSPKYLVLISVILLNISPASYWEDVISEQVVKAEMFTHHGVHKATRSPEW